MKIKHLIQIFLFILLLPSLYFCQKDSLCEQLEKQFHSLPTDIVMKMPELLCNRDSILNILNYAPYPAGLKNKEEGKVLVSITIDTNGTPMCYKIVKSVTRELNNSALKLIKSMNLKFSPGVYNHKKVPVIMVLQVIYRDRK